MDERAHRRKQKAATGHRRLPITLPHSVMPSAPLHTLLPSRQWIQELPSTYTHTESMRGSIPKGQTPMTELVSVHMALAFTAARGLLTVWLNWAQSLAFGEALGSEGSSWKQNLATDSGF